MEHFRAPRVLGGALYQTITALARFFNTRLVGARAPITGALPAIRNGDFGVQAGSDSVGTDGSGNATITFPQAFDEGLLTVVATPSLGTARVTSGTLTSFTINSSEPSSTISLNWVAVGW